MTLVFVDSCSFTYYRVTATLSWWKKFNTTTDTSLIDYMEKQYIKNLQKIATVIDVPINQMLLIRDCPRDDIWRIKHYPPYKQNRKDAIAPTAHGPYIKHLNTAMKHLYHDVMRVPEAEADDIIGVLTRYHASRQIIIISTDSDFKQLQKYPNVRIYHPKTGWISNDPTSLDTKIQKGDPTDNIPASLPIHLKKLLIDLSCIPRTIQDRIMSAYSTSSAYSESSASLTYRPMSVQLGLCCINTQLHARKIFCSRTIRLDTVNKLGLCELQRRSLLNCKDLLTHLKWNAEHGYRVFRISSDLFPHMNNCKSPFYKEFNLQFAHDILREVGQFARDTGQRLTFHPGQYNVVGTPHEDKFQNTIGELDWHAEVLDIMGCGPDSVLVVHGGGIYGDKPLTISRWITNFKRLPERIQRRLVLENCEKSFSVKDCLTISDATGVPVVLDTHHFDCYNILHPTEQLDNMATYLPAVLKTWSLRHMKPKCHVSQQCCGKQIGAHSDMITELPACLLDIPKLYNVSIDIMIEAKFKEQAIEALYLRHPELNPTSTKTKTNKIVGIIKTKNKNKIVGIIKKCLVDPTCN
jgi:UV damage endonuclease UvdE